MIQTSPPSSDGHLDELLASLRSVSAGDFERLVAALATKLIGVPFAIARAGFQHGSDAGTAGRQNRHLRIEAKKYADGTPLKERELLGELEQAGRRDPALELWILATTQAAPQQLEDSLALKGAKIGVPVLMLDWKPDAFPALAALCASAPDIVAQIAGPDAGRLSTALAVDAAPAIAALQREFAAWAIGYDALSEIARATLMRQWESPREARAAFGQDVAGGAKPLSIVREAVDAALDEWIAASPPDAPAVLVGDEGTGKTWAAIGWLVRRRESLPIILTFPSGALPVGHLGGSTALIDVIGQRLHDITGVRDPAHWAERVRRLLMRPSDEGPALILLFDGLNQGSGVEWLDLMSLCQASPFAGLMLVIATTRRLFLEDRLGGLKGLIVEPTSILVAGYDTEPGGELDRMLRLHNLELSRFPLDLIPFARIPRLFELIVRLRHDLNGIERITPYRILWEYGRDTLGVRSGHSFSEKEWREWLRDVAKTYRETGSASMTRRALEQTASSPSLTPGEVFNRLSDIVDGRFAEPDPSGELVLRPDVVAHGLGLLVVEHLDADRRAGGTDPAEVLGIWLEAISGLDQRAEILRAAVTIVADRKDATGAAIPAAIVTAWLQTQNLPENHDADVYALARDIVRPLLSAIAASHSGAFAAVRDLAVDALRAVPRDDVAVRTTVLETSLEWASVVSRDVTTIDRRSPEGEAARSSRYLDRVGADQDGDRMTLGRMMRFVANDAAHCSDEVPALVQGYPLDQLVDILEVAAIGASICDRHHSFDSLRWLVLLDDAADAVAPAIRRRAADILGRQPESGVEPRLRERAAALLLRLTGDPADEIEAGRLEPRLGAWWTYEGDYEADPVNSLFALERRHADQVLTGIASPIHLRARRLASFWIDPTFQIGDDVRLELEAFADAFDVSTIDAAASARMLGVELAAMGPALARGAPAGLARLARRRIAAFAASADRRDALAAVADDAILLGDAETFRLLRDARRAEPAGDDREGDWRRQRILRAEIVDLDAEAQVDAILGSGIERLDTSIYAVLRTLDAAAGDRLFARHRGSDTTTLGDFVGLTTAMLTGLGDDLAEWLLLQALDEGSPHRAGSFELLALLRPNALGERLLASGWSWAPGASDQINHYGSIALAEATKGKPFATLVGRMAPWLLPHVATMRGAVAAEVAIAASLLTELLLRPVPGVPEPCSGVLVYTEARVDDPFALSLDVNEEVRKAELLEGLEVLKDRKSIENATRRAVDFAIASIRAARAEGASLYLASVAKTDVASMLVDAPDEVELWLSGYETMSVEFRRRVRLAEGFFIQLAAALLDRSPERGVAVWCAVRTAMTTRYIGIAGVEELLHVLFERSGDDNIDSFIRQLLQPTVSSSDDALLNVTLAARHAGRSAGLEALNTADAVSSTPWIRERALTLASMGTVDGFDVEWPDGRRGSAAARSAGRSVRLHRDAFARYWWAAYWNAPDGEEAFAAWQLLLRAADRRILVVIAAPWPHADAHDHLSHRKRAFARTGMADLRNAAEAADKDLTSELYDRKAIGDVSPWRRRPRRG